MWHSQTDSTTSGQPRCSLCLYPEWTVEQHPDEEYEIMLESFASTKAAAEEGCCGCTLLCEAWCYAFPESVVRGETQLNFNCSSEHLWIHIFGGGRVVDVEVFTLPGESRFMHIKTASCIPRSTTLSDNLRRIQGWTLSCEASHPQCSQNISYTPCRLLDLESEHPNRIKLVDMAHTEHAPKYACLSHCWGQTKSKHTTRHSNLSTNMTSISVPELPKTFQDAVEIARALGITYLWIDSLCIIQDSNGDWQNHVSTMAQIYENAYITLAAGNSSSDDGGFFSVAPKANAEPHSFQLDIDGKNFKFYVRHAIGHPDAGWPSNETLPLMSRGWCFQERLLARRYLCFGSKEIIWECQEEVACSCSMADGDFNPRPDSQGAGFSDAVPLKWRFAQLRSSHSMESSSLWRSLVTEYSSRQLTFPNDKLPALAGLATVFERTSVLGQYAQGMWSSSINTDLAWKYIGDDAPSGRPRDKPSWTWVSAADGRVEWPQLVFRATYNVHLSFEPGKPIEEFTQNTIDSYALAARHNMRVTGLLLRVSIRTWTDRNDFEQSFPLNRFCEVTIWERRHSESQLQLVHNSGRLVKPLEGTTETTHEKLAQTVETPPPSDKYGDFTADYRFWSSEEQLQQELQSAIFLPMGIEPSPRERKVWAGSHYFAAGIILRPTDRRSATLDQVTTYERIGWLRYCTRARQEDWRPTGFTSTFFII